MYTNIISDSDNSTIKNTEEPGTERGGNGGQLHPKDSTLSNLQSQNINHNEADW